jgi:lysophospholipase L1-like esterase
LELQDGDRVVLLGGTFVEREVRYGYLETALTSAFPQRQVTFRNLGWSGDTVWAESRGRFDPPQVGYQRMLELVQELKPTLLMFAYGANESFVGEAGLAPFIQQYEKLLDDLAPLKCRLVFFTPHQFEKPQSPLPDASRYNPMLGRYAQAIRELASRRKGWLVDLFHRTEHVVLKLESPSPQAEPAPETPRGFHLVDKSWHSLPLTENGIHLSPYGYLRVARIMVQQLHLAHPEFLVQLGSMGEPESLSQAAIEEFHSDGQQVRFRVTLSRLPEPLTPLFPRDTEFFVVAGGGLPSGHYTLKVDGEVAAVNPTLLVGFPVRGGPDYQQAEQLRRKIVDKNRLFFHRWRPQNIAYLTGFRKPEQGNNAAEIAQFDPLVENAEQEFAELKKPVTRQYEIVPRLVDEKK